jgi:cobalamin biosynthesis protein CobD/CbiB
MALDYINLNDGLNNSLSLLLNSLQQGNSLTIILCALLLNWLLVLLPPTRALLRAIGNGISYIISNNEQRLNRRGDNERRLRGTVLLLFYCALAMLVADLLRHELLMPWKVWLELLLLAMTLGQGQTSRNLSKLIAAIRAQDLAQARLYSSRLYCSASDSGDVKQVIRNGANGAIIASHELVIAPICYYAVGGIEVYLIALVVIMLGRQLRSMRHKNFAISIRLLYNLLLLPFVPLALLFWLIAGIAMPQFYLGAAISNIYRQHNLLNSPIHGLLLAPIAAGLRIGLGGDYWQQGLVQQAIVAGGTVKVTSLRRIFYLLNIVAAIIFVTIIMLHIAA